MRFVLGADHAGYEYRESILDWLKARDHTVVDVGTDSDESCDYPEYAHEVARRVATDPDGSRGILICGSGEGMSMVANRYTGVRAALCLSASMARKTRAHNDANCLVLAQRSMEEEDALGAVEAFIEGEFDGGRHARRIGKIDRPPLRVSDHALVQVKLTELRDASTDGTRFREALREITRLLVAEATRWVPTDRRSVTTEVAETEGRTLDRDVVLAPILRAGLGMMEAARELFPGAGVAHVGMSRDEQTLEAEEYLLEVPADLEDPLVIVLDPMVATGGTATGALNSLKERIPSADWRLISVVAAPEGVRSVHDAHPDVSIHAGSLDDGLNGDGLIVPGLGDAGDRLFGTG